MKEILLPIAWNCFKSDIILSRKVRELNRVSQSTQFLSLHSQTFLFPFLMTMLSNGGGGRQLIRTNAYLLLTQKWGIGWKLSTLQLVRLAYQFKWSIVNSVFRISERRIWRSNDKIILLKNSSGFKRTDPLQSCRIVRLRFDFICKFYLNELL